MVPMIFKIRNNEIVRYHIELDRTSAEKVMDYETPNGNVRVYVKEHLTFFIIDFSYQRLLILSESVDETIRTLRYLKQCGLSRGDCQ